MNNNLEKNIFYSKLYKISYINKNKNNQIHK